MVGDKHCSNVPPVKIRCFALREVYTLLVIHALGNFVAGSFSSSPGGLKVWFPADRCYTKRNITCYETSQRVLTTRICFFVQEVEMMESILS